MLASPVASKQTRRVTCRKVHLLQSLDHCNIIRYMDFFLEGSSEQANKLVIVFEW